jgi:hypothetical protein
MSVQVGYKQVKSVSKRQKIVVIFA